MTRTNNMDETGHDIPENDADALLLYNKSVPVCDAARFLHVHKNQIYRYAKIGLPYYRMGNRFTFRLKDLIEWREKFRIT